MVNKTTRTFLFSQALATEAWMMYYAIGVTILGTLGGAPIT